MPTAIPYYKYHALGNDYIVLNPAELDLELTAQYIRLICHRNFGVGSDGILLGPISNPENSCGLRIFNPDGSEAEKSGNGLRIFTRYLWDSGQIPNDTIAIETAGGPVEAQVLDAGRRVTVAMGRVSFNSLQIPVSGPGRDVINETIDVDGNRFAFCGATVGNPHCVIPQPQVSAEIARKWGSAIENDPRFPNRINVQFMQIIDRANIRIEIWERGAGYTLASGSSSSAAAAVAYRFGLCDRQITVHMPGGRIEIGISKQYDITMTGSVTKVSNGFIDPEIFAFKIP